MSIERMQHCYFCGEELGVYDKPYGARDTCGKRECEREATYDEQAERADARYRAEQDDFGAYR
jgi:hypothetical protein